MNRKNADDARRLGTPATIYSTATEERAEAAARASQAATATNNPGDDHGAGAGQDKPAAANSGARMRPEDVPEELVTMMADAELDAPPGCSAADSYRTVLAAVIPAIRAAIADEIEAACPDPDASHVGDHCDYLDAARIARGDQ